MFEEMNPAPPVTRIRFTGCSTSSRSMVYPRPPLGETLDPAAVAPPPIAIKAP